MSDEPGLIRAICEQPADDTVRLAYADWLDEQPVPDVRCEHCNGSPRRAFSRPPSSTNWVPTRDGSGFLYQCFSCNGAGETADTSRRDRAEFIRLQVWHSRHWPTHPRSDGCSCESCAAFRRCDELLRAWGERWLGPVYAPCDRVRWYRGFVETIELPWHNFIARAGEMFAAHPITRVNFPDFDPVNYRPGSRSARMWAWRRGGGVAGGVPEVLFARLKASPKSNGQIRRYKTADKARQDLTRAGATLGRDLCDPPLPPLTRVSQSVQSQSTPSPTETDNVRPAVDDRPGVDQHPYD